MHYQNVREARFLDRPNRFIAHAELNGAVETVHVKNTGRCRELLVPGCTVYLEKGTNPNRKTAYDLIAVEKGTRLINMDAQAPNKVFAEWAAAGNFLPDVTAIRPEYAYGASRLDFCLETPEGTPSGGGEGRNAGGGRERPLPGCPDGAGGPGISGSFSRRRKAVLTRCCSLWYK